MDNLRTRGPGCSGLASQTRSATQSLRNRPLMLRNRDAARRGNGIVTPGGSRTLSIVMYGSYGIWFHSQQRSDSGHSGTRVGVPFAASPLLPPLCCPCSNKSGCPLCSSPLLFPFALHPLCCSPLLFPDIVWIVTTNRSSTFVPFSSGWSS